LKLTDREERARRRWHRWRVRAIQRWYATGTKL